ncbi:DUF5324 family protein [Kitasatospora sp. CB01950]|uniref:DUF5324 family protein n=1 Tax=Kitasatospora sp. CB01950 TaxID=1703930 RepID=UPI0009393CA8|nr:DUF5324 family protein [Kitasatospora sp. CB01950]
MSRTDTARETAARAKDAVAPYAASAKETALHYAEEAKQVLGPKLEALGPKAAAAGAQARSGAGQAAQAARVQYVKHLAPHLEQAFFSLPPDTQKAALKAVHRAQEAALAAKLSAGQAACQARTNVAPKVVETFQAAKDSVVPLAQEAQSRGAAAITALQGNVSAAEIGELAAKNAKKKRCNGWATGLAVAGAVAIGTGVVAWQWLRRQNNPEWLVEPPEPATAPSATTAARPGTATGAPVGGATLNGSVPNDDPEAAGAAEASESAGASPAPKSGPSVGHPAEEDDRPKPHDPRKPH